MWRKFNVLLGPRDRENLRRLMEVTGISKAEVVRRALEQYRQNVDKQIAAEAERSMASQGAS